MKTIILLLSFIIASESFARTNGNVYRMPGSGNIPSWGPVNMADGTNAVTGALGIANGGSGQTSANAALNAFLPDQTGNANKCLKSDGTNTSWATFGAGSVTSVDLAVPAEFSVSGNPITSSGTITISKASQSQNLFYASPDGSSGAPSFRSIVAADVPTLNQNTTGTASNVTGTVAIANGGTGQTSASAAINALLPTQTGNNGKFLTTDGSVASWANTPGGGTAKKAKYQFVIGSAAEVTAGTADYSSIATALTANPSNASFLITAGYSGTENVTIAGNKILIEGQGAVSTINGTITVNSNIQHFICRDLRVTGNVTVSSGAKYTRFEAIVASTVTVTDNSGNSDNLFLGIKE